MKGKVVLLTGATSPVDSALAIGLANLGAIVHLAGPTGPLLDQLAEEGIKTFGINIASRPEFVSVVDQINTHHGHIDLLINAAGATVLGKVQNLEPEDWEETFNTNILGTINAIELVYPSMVCEPSPAQLSSIMQAASHTVSTGRWPPWTALPAIGVVFHSR